MATSDALLLSERDARGVLRLTLNRPDAFNALSEGMRESLLTAFDAARVDEGLRAIVLGGAGRAFCAGHDLKEMRAEPAKAQALFASCSAMMQEITALPQPVIAAVNGLATAAGCQLVAQCDLAVAASNAHFAVSGVNLGLFCSTPSVALSRNVGRKRAAEMLFTGDFISAYQAEAWGLVNRVVPPEQLMEATRALAARMLSKPAEALALGKALFYRQLEERMGPAYRDASCTIAGNFDTDYAREGIDAFIAKRPPDWKR